jgi:hypothetical protein
MQGEMDDTIHWLQVNPRLHSWDGTQWIFLKYVYCKWSLHELI